MSTLPTIVTPGRNTHSVRSVVSAPICVSQEKNTVSGAIIVTPASIICLRIPALKKRFNFRQFNPVLTPDACRIDFKARHVQAGLRAIATMSVR